VAHLFVAVLDVNAGLPSQWRVSAEAATEQELRDQATHDGRTWIRVRNNGADVDSGTISLTEPATGRVSAGRVYRLTRSNLPKLHPFP
jgi:hypothetical protein